MDLRFKRIVVVGGGTAGWMAAVALATAVKGSSVELVESDEIGIVGVGEATFPSIRNFHALLGIDEAEFLRATNGTYKLGIEFRDWRVPGERYFHTFGDFGDLSGPNAVWGQHQRIADPGLGALDRQCLPSVMASQGRFCTPTPQQRFDYAYHFDAALYAGFLRKLAVTRGVRRTEGRIVEVTRRADGAIDQLTLDDGRVVAGDLFIDCSGLASLLLGGALEEPFVDFSRWLPADRAWAVPSAPGGPALTPHTIATALEAGWAWRIPLSNRVGNGYVFSSRYIDEDRARAQLLAQLDGPALAEPRLLRFSTGHRARVWVHNVVALGLSSGFLEPLESTSIYLIQRGLSVLVDLLVSGRALDAPVLADYNCSMVRQFTRVRDFILLHYCLTGRRDSALWRAMATLELPDTLAFKIRAWRQAGVLHQYEQEAFDATSWLAIHAGMQHWPQHADPALRDVASDAALHGLRWRRDAIAAAVAAMPAHHAYLGAVLAP